MSAGSAIGHDPQHELARMQDERLVALYRHKLGEVLHRLLDVDEGVARVAKDAEGVADADVDAARLHHRVVERIDHDPAGGNLLADRPVGQHHPRDCTE